MAFGIGAGIRAEKRGFREEKAKMLARPRMAEIEKRGEFALRATKKSGDTSSRLSTARPAPEVPYLPESREKGRLGDIMRASPKELRGIYERMPTEERPIHTIRGTEQAYWSPGTKREYGSLRTAMTGFRPRPEGERARAGLSGRSKADRPEGRLTNIQRTNLWKDSYNNADARIAQEEKEGILEGFTSEQKEELRNKYANDRMFSVSRGVYGIKFGESTGEKFKYQPTWDEQFEPQQFEADPQIWGEEDTAFSKGFTPAGTPRTGPPFKGLGKQLSKEMEYIRPWWKSTRQSLKKKFAERKHYPIR